MPKNQYDRIIDRPYTSGTSGGSISISGSSGGSTGVTDHGLLTGLADDDHTQYLNTTRGDARYIAGTRILTAGAGLTGGGDLTADRTFAVGAGLGITVNADDVALASTVAGDGLTYSSGVLAVGAGNGLTVAADSIALTAPGTLTVATGNSAAGSHTHAVTSSSNPGAAASLLATDASGFLTLVKLTTPTLAAAADLTIDPAGDDILIAASARLGSDNYASQTTGWRVDYAGAGDFRYLFADELHAKSFITDLEQALAGGQIIPKSVAMLSRAFTLPSAGAAATLYLRDLPSAENMAVFESGDIVRLRTFSRASGSLTIADAWGVVTAYSDLADKEQSWTFTRSSAPNAGTATGTIAADSLALDYGVSGNGLHEVNAIDGLYGVNSPYSQVVTWTTHPATGSAVRVRTGNLRGITGSTEYGLWAGSTSAHNLLVTGDKVALRQGTTEYITLDSAGNSYFAGVMTIGTSGEIRQGTGTLGSNYTGLRIWRDTNVGRIGGYNNNTLQWYGSTDGRLYGGTGKTWIDASGISVEVNAASSFSSTYAVNWYTGVGGTRKAGIGAYTVSSATVLGIEVNGHQLTLDQAGRLSLVNSGGVTSFSSVANSYTNVVNNLGVGLDYDATPSARLHVVGTTPDVRIGSGAAGQNIYLSFYDGDTTLKGRFIYAGTASAGGQYIGFANYDADYLAFFSDDVRWLSFAGTERMRLDSTGLGIGGTPGTNEKLRVSGGTGITILKLDSAHPQYGPTMRLSATATGGREYGIRSSQHDGSTGDTGGEGNFQIVDYTASAVRWTLDSSGNVTQTGKLTVNGGVTLPADNGVLTFYDRGTDPPAPDASNRVLMYMRDNKFFIVYRDTGSSVTRYRWLDLEDDTGTWSQNTTAPAGG